MPIRRYKDMAQLVAQFNLNSSRKPHYLQVYIWQTKEALVSNTGGTSCTACHCPSPWAEDIDTGEREVRPKLGELHFTADDWDEEIVSHELMHAILHRMRVLSPDVKKPVDQDPDITEEEEVCYEYGRWLRRLRVKLWTLVPPERVL